MQDLNNSYRGALIAITIVTAMAWLTTPAEAHETVFVDVENANGVIYELCNTITNQAVVIDDIDEEDAQALYEPATRRSGRCRGYARDRGKRKESYNGTNPASGTTKAGEPGSSAWGRTEPDVSA